MRRCELALYRYNDDRVDKGGAGGGGKVATEAGKGQSAGKSPAGNGDARAGSAVAPPADATDADARGRSNLGAKSPPSRTSVSPLALSKSLRAAAPAAEGAAGGAAAGKAASPAKSPHKKQKV